MSSVFMCIWEYLWFPCIPQTKLLYADKWAELNLDTCLISTAVASLLPGGRSLSPHRCRGTARVEARDLQGQLQCHDCRVKLSVWCVCVVINEMKCRYGPVYSLSGYMVGYRPPIPMYIFYLYIKEYCETLDMRLNESRQPTPSGEFTLWAANPKG